MGAQIILGQNVLHTLGTVKCGDGCPTPPFLLSSEINSSASRHVRPSQVPTTLSPCFMGCCSSQVVHAPTTSASPSRLFPNFSHPQLLLTCHTAAGESMADPQTSCTQSSTVVDHAGRQGKIPALPIDHVVWLAQRRHVEAIGSAERWRSFYTSLARQMPNSPLARRPAMGQPSTSIRVAVTSNMYRCLPDGSCRPKPQQRRHV